MTPPTAILGCVPWGQQQVPSVQSYCWVCESAIAISVDNATAAIDMVTLCIACVFEFEPIEEIKNAKGLWGGVAVPMSEAVRRADAERSRN